MVEDDWGKIIPTSLLLRPTTPLDRDSIVKLTGSDTMESITDEVRKYLDIHLLDHWYIIVMYIYPPAHAGMVALIVATSTQGGITWASNCTATTLALH